MHALESGYGRAAPLKFFGSLFFEIVMQQVEIFIQ